MFSTKESANQASDVREHLLESAMLLRYCYEEQKSASMQMVLEQQLKVLHESINVFDRLLSE